MSVEDRVKAEIKRQLGVRDEQIVRNASFIGDLGADDLDVVELIICIEEEFGLFIPGEDADKLDTVGKLIDYLKSKL